MKKEWLLLAGSVVITLGLALLGIRWFAPQLLGISSDLRLVQVSEEVSPFYEAVFPEDAKAGAYGMVDDPYVGRRPEPLMLEGSTIITPRDVLGFRNRYVPVVADVITLGDSQTSGNGVPMELNWPSLLKHHIADRNLIVYNTGVDSWGGIQYLYILKKMTAFRPRVAIVAFYTGNDPVDSLNRAYAMDRWADLRSYDKRPEIAPHHRLKDSDLRPVKFSDGIATAFTPERRLTSNNRDYPGTREGYLIMAKAAEKMDEIAFAHRIHLIFTIVPTKEYVYGDKVHEEGITIDDAYEKLIDDEGKNIEELSHALQELKHSEYVDTAAALRKAALSKIHLYRTTFDGHPAPNGYDVIASTLSKTVTRLLPPRPKPGPAIIQDLQDKKETYVFLNNGKIWFFKNQEVMRANGWSGDSNKIQRVSLRDIEYMRRQGVVSVVDTAHFGPGALTRVKE